MITSGAQDLRVSLPTSCQQPQQHDLTATYQPSAVTEPPHTRVAFPPDSAAAPPPPPFGLGLIAVGPHTSFGVVPTAPTSNASGTGGDAALNIPVVLRHSQNDTSGTTGGGPIRRRVSDKTALPISTGND